MALLIAPLEPAVRAAVLVSLPSDTRFSETLATGADLVREAIASGSSAAVDRRDAVAELEYLPSELVIVGASTSSYDVLVVERGRLDHWWNPSLEAFGARLGDFGKRGSEDGLWKRGED